MPRRPSSHHADLRRIQGASASSIEDAARRKADPSQAEADALVHTGRWARLRALVLNREPLCRVCTNAGRTVPASSVDHITPRQVAPDLAYVESNLQPLCSACHALKSQQERGRGVRYAVDRAPYDAERRQTAPRTRDFPPTTGGDATDA